MHEKDKSFDREVARSAAKVDRYSDEQMAHMIDRLKSKARERDESSTYAVLEEIKRRLGETSGAFK